PGADRGAGSAETAAELRQAQLRLRRPGGAVGPGERRPARPAFGGDRRTPAGRTGCPARARGPFPGGADRASDPAADADSLADAEHDTVIRDHPDRPPFEHAQAVALMD